MKPTIAAQVDNTLSAARQSFNSGTLQSYEELDRQVSRAETLTREAYQNKLRREYWAIVQKLENGNPLTPEEQEVVRLLVVGDAKYYLSSENDFQEWEEELKRLVQEMEQMKGTGLDDVDELLRLQALCREVNRVLPDILYYLREQQRIQRFETSMQGPIDAETGRFLADFLKELMKSSQM